MSHTVTTLLVAEPATEEMARLAHDSARGQQWAPWRRDFKLIIILNDWLARLVIESLSTHLSQCGAPVYS